MPTPGVQVRADHLLEAVDDEAPRFRRADRGFQSAHRAPVQDRRSAARTDPGACTARTVRSDSQGRGGLQPNRRQERFTLRHPRTPCPRTRHNPRIRVSIRHRTSAGISYRGYRRLRASLVQHAIANGLACPECGQQMRHGQALHVDHITPVAYGGTNHPTNLRITHARCNMRKGARATSESRTPLRGSRQW